jgi:ribonuclease PH
MPRIDARANDQLRPVEIIRNYLKYAEGSVLISTGDTKIICTATVEENVPNWLNGMDQGWITAEYGMLPRATTDRTNRYKMSGRSQEIQRLVGRSLRAAVDLKRLGTNTIRIDCDVIQADGGTRTASITGGYVALIDALNYMVDMDLIEEKPLLGTIAAVSVGVVDDEILLDLCYTEDSVAEVDMNIVMLDDEFVEIQGTGEGSTFNRNSLESMLGFAIKGIKELMKEQRNVLSG